MKVAGVTRFSLGRRIGLAAAVLSVPVIAVVVPPSALASPMTVNVDYQCLTAAPTLGGTLSRIPQTMQVTIDAPVAGAPGSTVPVVVTIGDIPPYRRPLSPPVALTNVTVNLQASLDIVTNQANTPPAPSVPSTSTVSGLDPLGVSTATQVGNTPWVSAPSITLNVPLTNTPGDRLWLRPGQIDFQFSATGGPNPNAAVLGTTSCIPVNAGEVLPASEVTNPTYGDYSRVNAPSPMRIGVAGVPPPAPVDQCTAQSGNQTGGTGCDTSQVINAIITAGNLTQVAHQTGSNPNSTTVNMGQVTVASTTQVLSAPLNTITVSDLRGGDFGWTLSGVLLGPLTNGSAETMAQSLLSISGLTCVGDANSAPPTAGVTGNFGASRTLCSVAAGALGPSQSGSGIYDVAGTLSLDVPAFQHIGTYYGVLRITLI